MNVKNNIEKEACDLSLYIPNLNKDISTKLFDRIIPGDIIFAPTTRISTQLEQIDTSHRIRPHYVVEKQDDTLITYCGTSNLQFELTDFIYMDLKKYGLKKGGNVDLGRYKIIKDSEIISYFDHLKIKDICKVNKKIAEIKNKDEQNHIKKIHPFFAVAPEELEVGMILNYNSELYCIYDISVGFIILCKLKEDVSEYIFTINNKIYSIDFENKITIHKLINQKMYPLQTSSVTAINSIVNEKEETNFEFCLKPDESIKKEYEFKYPIGQIFIKEKNEREFVYLFSTLGFDYGIEVRPGERITKIKPLPEKIKRKKVLKEEEADDILTKVIAKEPEYKWLSNHVAKIRECSKNVRKTV